MMNRRTAMARGFGPTNVTRDESPFITGGSMFETLRYKGFFLALEGLMKCLSR